MMMIEIAFVLLQADAQPHFFITQTPGADLWINARQAEYLLFVSTLFSYSVY